MPRDAVDQLFTQVSQSPKLKTQSMEKFRKDLLQKAKEFYERFIREQFDAPVVRYDLGLAYHRLGEIHRELGDYSAAEDSLAKAIALLDPLGRTVEPTSAATGDSTVKRRAGLGPAAGGWRRRSTDNQQGEVRDHVEHEDQDLVEQDAGEVDGIELLR